MDLHSSLLVGLSVEGGQSAAAPAPDPLAACWLVQRREAEACLSAQDVRRPGEPGPAHRGGDPACSTPRARPLAELSASITRASPGRRGSS